MATSGSPFTHGRSEVRERADVSSESERVLKALGAYLRVRRINRQRGWSLEEAAERIGIHAKHLQRIEAGRANVTVRTLVAISLAYELPLRLIMPPRRQRKAGGPTRRRSTP